MALKLNTILTVHEFLFIGILVDIETDPVVEAPKCFSEMYDQIKAESEDTLNLHLSHDKIRENYKVPVFDIGGKR
jgi:hypothetical protein